MAPVHMERGISQSSDTRFTHSFPHGVQFIAGEREIAGRIWTVGHSTHELPAFLALLERHGIELLADVRTVPKSRRMPWFWKDALAASLPEAGIAYEHFGDLGGFRRPRPDSPNAGWRVEAFRGYADYMDTPGFRAALERLEAAARGRRAAVMCAEAQWHRCHRRLISDALTVRGWEVCHIGSTGRVERHSLTPFAAVDGDRLSYPPEQAELDL
jgi:uncharacterized protein (DUF488 family)